MRERFNISLLDRQRLKSKRACYKLRKVMGRGGNKRKRKAPENVQKERRVEGNRKGKTVHESGRKKRKRKSRRVIEISTPGYASKIRGKRKTAEQSKTK